MTRTLLLAICCAGVIGGCMIHRDCPPVRGIVLDARTRAPIEDAKVTIGYLDSRRVGRTDGQGHFAFPVKVEFFLVLPGPMDPISRFDLRVEAGGYAASDPMRYGPWMGLGPPRPIPEGDPGKPRFSWSGEVLVVDPILLTPSGTQSSRDGE